MDSNSLLRQRFKAQVHKFSGIITKELGKVRARLVREMLYGIQATKDVKLSNISRSLNESVKFIKTEDRLSRNLAAEDLTDPLNDEICRLASGKINDEMVLALDPGDIRKPYAESMQWLCRVRDGDKHETANGYALCKVVASDCNHQQVLPLYCEAYSYEADGFKSMNAQLFKAIDCVSNHIGNKGVWAIDRQGDSQTVFRKLIRDQKQFVVRLKSNRNVIHGKKTINVAKLAANITTPYEAKIIRYKDGKEKQLAIEYGVTEVRLPVFEGSREEQTFQLVVVKGFGQQPLMLLTNRPVNAHVKEEIWHIAEIYLTRWKCEESYRYIKQSYQLEDLRVRSYTAIRNTVVLVLAVAYFASVYLGQRFKLKVMVEKVLLLSERFFGVPSFFNYAMADGIYKLLSAAKTGLAGNYKPPPEDRFQLSLNLD